MRSARWWRLTPNPRRSVLIELALEAVHPCRGAHMAPWNVRRRAVPAWVLARAEAEWTVPHPYGCGPCRLPLCVTCEVRR